MKQGSDLYYEEYGVKKSTQFFRSIVYGLMNLYPFYLVITMLLNVNDIITVIIAIVSSMIYILSVLKIDVLTTIFSITLPFITVLVMSSDSPIHIHVIALYIFWILVSDYIVENLFKEKTRSKWYVKLYSPLTGFSIFIIFISVFIIVSYYVSQLILQIYEYIVLNTPVIFQEFYRVFIITRLGSLFFIIIIIFTLFYILENYLSGIISDTILLSTRLARSRILSLFREELYSNLRLKDPINTLFMRTTLFVIFYYVYGLIYPVLTIISKFFIYRELYIIFYLTIWFLLSTLTYTFIKRILYNILTVFPQNIVYPTRTYRSFYLSLILLTIYVVAITITSPQDLPIIFSGLLGLNRDNPVYKGYLTREISRLYLDFSENLYNYINWYIGEVVKAYYVLTDIINRVLKLLWG